MTHREIRERLDAYIDGTLPQSEQRGVAQHLAGCPACRREADALSALVADLGRLPDRAPDRDLWPGISAQIGGRQVLSVDFGRSERRPTWFRNGLLAAAAVVLMALSSALTVYWMSGASNRAVPASYGVSVGDTPADLRAVAVSYRRVIEDLHGVLAERKHTLRPETVKVIEKNLQVIDEAIRTLGAALAADPGNQDLIRKVSAMYEQKVDLLQQATDLPAGVSRL